MKVLSLALAVTLSSPDWRISRLIFTSSKGLQSGRCTLTLVNRLHPKLGSTTGCSLSASTTVKTMTLTYPSKSSGRE